MSTLIISTSLNPSSRSAFLAQAALEQAKRRDYSCSLLDLRAVKLPLCDGGACFREPAVGFVRETIERAAAILVASPVYNYSIGASLKNLLELTGSAWAGKPVGFLCAAGGKGSYMAVMPFANGLMLDFRCPIVPRFVFADGSAFDDHSVCDASVIQRIADLVEEVERWKCLGMGLDAG